MTNQIFQVQGPFQGTSSASGRVQKLNHEQVEWELNELTARKEAEDKNQDYDRVKALETQADVADKMDAAKRRKTKPDTGLLALRQCPCDKDEGCRWEEQFYPGADTLIQGSHYPTDGALDKLSEDVRKQMKKRDQYHRRRMFDVDAPIDFINERNRRFNHKLERYFGKYTEDIKEDLREEQLSRRSLTAVV
uniref:Pre-mRNA-splicing factor SYF2 n=1 Tax=Ditylenchus dipsaci TaxID=166011 RepID=A0A915DNW1_9BILA